VIYGSIGIVSARQELINFCIVILCLLLLIVLLHRWQHRFVLYSQSKKVSCSGSAMFEVQPAGQLVQFPEILTVCVIPMAILLAS